MERKARLAAQIARGLKARRLTEKAAAEHLGCEQAELSKLRRGQFRSIDEAKLRDMLAKLGHDVTIVVGRAKGRGRAGSMRLQIS